MRKSPGIRDSTTNHTNHTNKLVHVSYDPCLFYFLVSFVLFVWFVVNLRIVNYAVFQARRCIA
jgi:hypothetical protein